MMGLFNKATASWLGDKISVINAKNLSDAAVTAEALLDETYTLEKGQYRVNRESMEITGSTYLFEVIEPTQLNRVKIFPNSGGSGGRSGSGGFFDPLADDIGGIR